MRILFKGDDSDESFRRETYNKLRQCLNSSKYKDSQEAHIEIISESGLIRSVVPVTDNVLLKEELRKLIRSCLDGTIS